MKNRDAGVQEVEGKKKRIKEKEQKKRTKKKNKKEFQRYREVTHAVV